MSYCNVKCVGNRQGMHGNLVILAGGIEDGISLRFNDLQDRFESAGLTGIPFSWPPQSSGGQGSSVHAQADALESGFLRETVR
jgi:hypothetical protein